MKIQLKRSNVLDGSAAKQPTPEQMEYGELAVNYAATDPSVFIKDSSNNIIKIAGSGALTDKWSESGNNLYPTNLNSTILIGPSSPGNPNIVLSSTGFGSFTGNLTTEGDIAADGTILAGNTPVSALNSGVFLNNTGIIVVSTTVGTDDVFRGFTTGNSVATSGIKANGDATFVGDVLIGAGGSISLQKDGTGTFDTKIKTGNLTLQGAQLVSTAGINIVAGGTSAINFKTKHPQGNYSFFNTAETFQGNLKFNTLTSSRNYEFPDDGGTVALTKNLPWQTVTGGIAYMGGNVGIGTTLPVSALDVVGRGSFTGGVKVTGGTASDVTYGIYRSGTNIKVVHNSVDMATTSSTGTNFNGAVVIGNQGLSLTSGNVLLLKPDMQFTSGNSSVLMVNPQTIQGTFDKLSLITARTRSSAAFKCEEYIAVEVQEPVAAANMTKQDGSLTPLTGLKTEINGADNLNINALGTAPNYFEGAVKTNGGILANTLTAYSSGSALTFQTNNGNGNYVFKKTDGTAQGNLRFNNLTANRIFNFPNTAGTLVVEDGSGTLDITKIEVGNLTLENSTISSTNTLTLAAGGTSSLFFKTKNNNGNYTFSKADESFSANLRFENITATRSFNFPDNGGTIALTSDSAWVTGSTSTSGILTLGSDSSASFSGVVSAASGFKGSEYSVLANGDAVIFKTLHVNGNYIFKNTSDFNGVFRFENLTQQRVYNWPNTAGTVLLEDGNGVISVTEIEVGNLTLEASTLSSSGTLNLQAGGTGAIAFQTKDTNGNYTFKTTDGSFNGRLQFNDITAQRTYKYPDQNGTIVVKNSTTGALTIDNLTLDGSTLSSSTSLNFESGGSAAINFKSSTTNNDYRFYNTAQTFYGSLRFNTLTSNRSFNFPNEGGTLIVQDGNGAISVTEIEVGNLTLESNSISSTSTLTIAAGGTSSLFFKTKNNNGNYTFSKADESFNGNLRFENLTATRSFNFPDNGGTIALTSDSVWVTGSTSTSGILTLASDLSATFNGDLKIGTKVTINQGNGSIISSGNIQAGGSPAGGAAEGCRVDNSGTIRAGKSTGSSAIWTGYQVGTSGATSRINADGSASFNGTVTATVVPPSDARFKENITPAKPQLADVVALGKLLKNYDWNDQAPVNDELRSQRQLGLIAQEVAEVCPSITKTLHGTSEDTDEEYKGISHDALIMKLIGAVAELKAET